MTAVGGIGRAPFVVILLNGLFLLLSLYSALLPDEKITSTARQAFQAGALTDSDYLPRDSERGYNQSSDCLIIQLIVNDTTLLDDALAPLELNTDNWSTSCPALRTILFKGKERPDTE
jgi:hypothetical protein